MTPHAESEVLSAYLDGELERAAAASVETHLGECPDCAARLAGLQETVASLRRLERPPLPEAVTRGLRQRLQRERERPRRTAWLDALLPWRSLQPGMAAAVLVSGALLFLAYAGYVQRERASAPVVFSAESRQAPQAAPAPETEAAEAPQEGPAPTVPAPQPAPTAPAPRPPAAPPPTAESESALAAGVADAIARSEEEPALADAGADQAAGAEADAAAAGEPGAERSRRESRSAAAELKAAGELEGAAAAPAAAQAAPAAEQPPPPDGTDEPLLLGPGMEKPVKIAGEELEFARLREARWPPRVILEAVITRQGRMEEVRFVEPPDLDPRIAAELRRTLQTWRYRPATRDGRPVAVRMTITAHIHLR